MRREAFLAAKEHITGEFEEARIIWLKTLEQLPIQEFNSKKGNPPRQTVKVNMKSSIVSSFHPINLSIQK